MSHTPAQFHESAIRSALFKGRSDVYFCFLKTEKIAHVLTVLAERASETHRHTLEDLARAATLLPASVARYAAGQEQPGVVLAGLFSTLAAVRLADTQGALTKQNAQIIAAECEHLITRLGDALRVSPFVSVDDFALPPLPQPAERLLPLLSEYGQPSLSVSHKQGSVPDGSKRHAGVIKDSIQNGVPTAVQSSGSKEQQARLEAIKRVVFEKGRVSIKDISAVVRGCSEKTIQRELATLIVAGLVQKVGQRRWSVYVPASGVTKVN